MNFNVWFFVFNLFITTISSGFVWVAYELFGRYGLSRKRYFIKDITTNVWECSEERNGVFIPCNNAIDTYTTNEILFMAVITLFVVIMINLGQKARQGMVGDRS
jgi:hypothetical protein